MRQAKPARRNYSVSPYSSSSLGAAGTETRIGRLDRPFAVECSHDKATRGGTVPSPFGLYRACAVALEVDGDDLGPDNTRRPRSRTYGGAQMLTGGRARVADRPLAVRALHHAE